MDEQSVTKTPLLEHLTLERLLLSKAVAGRAIKAITSSNQLGVSESAPARGDSVSK